MGGYILSVDQVPEGMHPRKGYTRQDGTPVRPTLAHNPRPRRKPPQNGPDPPRGLGKIKLTVSLAIPAAVVTIVLYLSLGGSSSGGDDLTVQVRTDLAQVIAVLTRLGFHSTHRTISSADSHSNKCARSATGEVQAFLSNHRCKGYVSIILAAHRKGIDTKVVVTWVVMPRVRWASQYKTWANKYGKGNPPGEPIAFNGHCYASRQNGKEVWTEQVQPTGNTNIDREILQAAAPNKLSLSYLQVHCTH